MKIQKGIVIMVVLAGLLIATEASAQMAPFWKLFMRRAAQKTASTTATSTPVVATSSPKAADLPCIDKAITNRETVLGNSFGQLSTSISEALNVRKTALIAAWNMADKQARFTARNSAWSTYNQAVKTAKTVYTKAVKMAWSQYRTDAKTCGVPISKVEPEETEAGL